MTPSFLFETASDSQSTVTLKPLSQTRWTARTATLKGVCKDNEVLLETLEVLASTHDKYGLKVGGLLQSSEKFSTLFGLRLTLQQFGAAEQLSLTLQKKDIALQDNLTGVEAAKSCFKWMHSDEEVNYFYDDTVASAQEHTNQPELPRYH